MNISWTMSAIFVYTVNSAQVESIGTEEKALTERKYDLCEVKINRKQRKEDLYRPSKRWSFDLCEFDLQVVKVNCIMKDFIQQ